MNRYYIIVPAILLVLFSVAYVNDSRHREEKEKARLEEVRKKEAEELAKKKAAEEKARKDAAERTAAREAEERKKQEEKEAKYKARLQKIRDDIARLKDQTANYTKLANKLEADLNELRSTKEKRNRETIELAKQVERTRIEMYNAQFEIQRINKMIAQRIGATSLASTPLVSVTPAPNPQAK